MCQDICSLDISFLDTCLPPPQKKVASVICPILVEGLGLVYGVRFIRVTSGEHLSYIRSVAIDHIALCCTVFINCKKQLPGNRHCFYWLLIDIRTCMRFPVVCSEIFPYLVIVIGLENVLVVTKSVVSTPVHLEVKLRVAQGNWLEVLYQFLLV